MGQYASSNDSIFPIETHWGQSESPLPPARAPANLCHIVASNSGDANPRVGGVEG